MKEFIEKLIGRLEEISVENTCSDCPYKAKCDEVQEHINDETTDLCGATIKALSIEIVNQLAEEYKDKYVRRETLNQYMWERDTAISQLKDLGYGFGEKVGWIPCSEKPEENQTVMLTFKNSAGLHVGEATYKNNMFFYITDTEFGYYEEAYKKPIAWQPLPDPYIPEGE